MNPEQMANRLYHPATGMLLRAQTKGLLNRLFASLRTPRKRVLAIFAIVLGCLWLSQAVATIFLRESADAESLRAWIPLALLTYSVWHIFKLATKKVEEPFAWTPSEREFVLAAPLTRTQQITYRMLSVFSAALAKAVCFTVLMIPDVPLWYAGLIGMLLGLAFVDLIRVSAELVIFGLGKTGRKWFRILVIGAATVTFVIAVVSCFGSQQAAAELSSPGALEFFRHLLREAMSLSETAIGQVLLAPFEIFSAIILATSVSVSWGVCLISGIILVGLMTFVTYRLDQWMLSSALKRERVALAEASQRRQHKPIEDQQVASRSVSVPWRLAGTGGLIWRQSLGAIHYWQSVVVAMVLPIFLSCLPLMANHSKSVMLLHIVGGTLFYSFLLLPSALILDFRRDINRMTVLKSLPISPLAVTIGQLATPVLICWMFQWSVLSIALISGKVIWWQAMMSGILILPITVLIFAIENYVFLLAPYQRNKEGFDVFLRTILTFTGKGLMFVIGIAMLIGAQFAITLSMAQTSLSLATKNGISLSCIWLLVFAVASGFVYAISRQYAKFDPSQDVPGIG
ncbi:MAG: hypothetical protein AAFN77_11050 [Planctomycetota bacterium]